MGLAILAAAACGAACNALWGIGDLTYESPTAGGGTGVVGGSGGSGQAGGAGGAPTGTQTTSSPGGMGGTGAGGAGGQPRWLVDRGLLVRYYVDEAASGQTPTDLADSAPNPLDLPITYTPEMTFVEQAGNRGLEWTATQVDGRAMALVPDTKIEQALDGATEATIESVIQVSPNTDYWSYVSHIGLAGDFGHFSLVIGSTAESALFWWESPGTTNSAGEWPLDFGALGRFVVHVVLDTSQANGDHRVRLFVNGGSVAVGTPSGYPIAQPALDEPIDLGGGSYFVLGNRDSGDRSYEGILFYSALYAVALTDSEIAINAEVLLADDDTPTDS
jgi:hypothetical protein